MKFIFLSLCKTSFVSSTLFWCRGYTRAIICSSTCQIISNFIIHLIFYQRNSSAFQNSNTNFKVYQIYLSSIFSWNDYEVRNRVEWSSRYNWRLILNKGKTIPSFLPFHLLGGLVNTRMASDPLPSDLKGWWRVKEGCGSLFQEMRGTR